MSDIIEAPEGEDTDGEEGEGLEAQAAKLLAPPPAEEAVKAEAELSPAMKTMLAKIDMIETAMMANDPELPNHLRNTHQYLRQFPELTHLLTAEDIGRWMRGQQKAVGLSQLADALAPKKPTSKASTKKVGLGDIF